MLAVSAKTDSQLRCRASTSSLVSLDPNPDALDSITAMSASDDSSEEPLPSLLDSLLLAEWEDRAQQVAPLSSGLEHCCSMICCNRL